MLRSFPTDIDMAHASAGRAVATPRDQLLELRPGAFGDGLHRAIETIHDPSREPEALRFLERRSAKINALDSAANFQMDAGGFGSTVHTYSLFDLAHVCLPRKPGINVHSRQQKI